MVKPQLVYFERWSHPVCGETLEASGLFELRKLAYSSPSAETTPALAAAHAYYASSVRSEAPTDYWVNKAFLQRCPALLAVATFGAGYDTVDLDACTQAGVVVVNQAGANSEGVAEHALGMLLALSKRIVEADRALRRDRPLQRTAFMGHDALGKTIGIVGLGRIGGRVAQLCRTLLEMRVLAYDPYITDDDFRARGAQRCDLDTLLQESDFVTVHCPLTNDTANMMSAREFALMKPDAYFIATARGGIHDEDALVTALREKRIAGAGLDVWAEEPPPLDHPLLAFDNVIVTPHTAGVTHESRYRIGKGAADQLIAIFRGERPPRLLNPGAWPRFATRFEKTFDRAVVG